ncbi:MAG: hypothetical protein WKI04_15585 [Ferruginibacter sp.]
MLLQGAFEFITIVPQLMTTSVLPSATPPHNQFVLPSHDAEAAPVQVFENLMCIRFGYFMKALISSLSGLFTSGNL